MRSRGFWQHAVANDVFWLLVWTQSSEWDTERWKLLTHNELMQWWGDYSVHRYLSYSSDKNINLPLVPAPQTSSHLLIKWTSLPVPGSVDLNCLKRKWHVSVSEVMWGKVETPVWRLSVTLTLWASLLVQLCVKHCSHRILFFRSICATTCFHLWKVTYLSCHSRRSVRRTRSPRWSRCWRDNWSHIVSERGHSLFTDWESTLFKPGAVRSVKPSVS